MFVVFLTFLQMFLEHNLVINDSGGMFLRSCEVMSSSGGVCGCERAAMDWNRRLTEFTQQWAFASQQPKFRACN